LRGGALREKEMKDANLGDGGGKLRWGTRTGDQEQGIVRSMMGSLMWGWWVMTES